MPAALSPKMAALGRTALLVWQLGLWVTAAVFAALYAVSYRRFRRAVPLEGPEAEAWLAAHPLKRKLRLRSLPGLASPLTYGVLRPVILLPEGLDLRSEETAFALEHEYIHVRRLDVLWKLLLMAAAAVHWFNPFVWLMWFLANRDLELSCDEEVLRRSDADRRGGYARALLAMEEKRSLLPPLHSGFGAGTTKERILAIMKYKKATVLSILLAAVLVAALAACALGGRKAAAGKALLPESLSSRLSAAAQLDEEGTLYYVSRSDEGWRELAELLTSLRGKSCSAPEAGETLRFQLSLADGETHELSFAPGAKSGEVCAALDGDWLRLKTKEDPGTALAELCRDLCPRPAKLTPAEDEGLTENSDALAAEMEWPDYDETHLRVVAIADNRTEQSIAYDSAYPFEFEYLGEWYRLPPRDGFGYQAPCHGIAVRNSLAAF